MDTRYFAERMERARLDDARLAVKLGVHPTTVWRWRTGRALPRDAQQLYVLLDALNADARKLFPDARRKGGRKP